MGRFMMFTDNVRHAFEDDEINYRNFSKLLVDTGRGTPQVPADKANQKIVETFRKVLGIDENSTRQEIRKAVRRNQVQIYDLIEESIQDLLISGWNENPFFRDYVDVRNIALGDKNEFYMEDDSILTVSRLSGNHHDIDRQRYGRGKTASISTGWYGLKIYAEFERILTGAEDWAAFVTKVYQAFDRHVNELLYKAFISAGNDLGTQWRRTGNVVDTVLRTLVEEIQMATGYEVVIMGTRAALANVTKLTGVEWASDDMKNEKYHTGRLGYWEGIRLVEFPQGFKLNDTTERLVDESLLFVMPVADNRFIKLVNEGESQIMQVNDSTGHLDMTYSYEYMQKLGVAVQTNLKWGIWDIDA